MRLRVGWALAAAAGLVATATTTARADEASRPYVSGRVGAYLPTGTVPAFGPNLDVEVAFGYRFLRNVAGELGFGYYQGTTGALVQELPGGPVTARLSLAAFPVTASVRGILPLGRLELSAIGGVGLHFLQVSIQAGPPTPPSDSDSAVSAHLGAAATFAVAPGFALGLDVRYGWASAKLFGSSMALDGLRAGVVLVVGL
ncbi:MAG TPA: outer membrane beta-barrel protein [Anaeromyxobacter sp.]|nr:outer membrane beta-barrel protein [Anaeromyxobacter sp.]